MAKKKLIKMQKAGVVKVTKEPFNNFIRSGYATGSSAEMKKDSANTARLDKIKADRKADLIKRGLVENKRGGSVKKKKK